MSSSRRGIRKLIPSGRSKHANKKLVIGPDDSLSIEQQSRNDDENASLASSITSQQREPVAPDHFQLQVENADLRERIKLLDNGMNKSELLDLLQEKDSELEKKNEQLTALNQKFHQISLGLDQMEHERKTMKHSSRAYQEERDDVKRQLENREREVQTLQSRCSIQEEKIKEQSSIRASLTKLQNENEQLREDIEKLNSNVGDEEKLKSSIAGLESTNESLRHQLANLKEKDSLESSQLRRTIEQKNAIILNHEKKMSEMDDAICSLMDSKKSENNSNKQKIDELKQIHQDQLNALNQSFGRREIELESKLSSATQKLTAERDDAIEKARQQSNSNRSYIAHLEEQLKEQNRGFQNVESRLQYLDSDLNEKQTKVDELQRDCNSKTDIIVALRADVEDKKLEINGLYDQISMQNCRIDELTRENEVIPDMETQMKNLLGSLTQLQDQNADQREEDLRTINQLENELKEKEQSLISAEEQIRFLEEEQEQKIEMEAELEVKLNDIEKLIESKNEAIVENEQLISSLRSELNECRAELTENEEAMCSLKEDRDQSKDEITKNEGIISSLRKDLEESKVATANIKKTYENRFEQIKKANEKVNNLLVNKQIELNELKSTLSSEKDENKKLKEECEKLREENKVSELQAAEIVSELEEKIERGRKEINQLKQKMIESKDDNGKMVRGIQIQLMASLKEKEEAEKKMKMKMEDNNKELQKERKGYEEKLAILNQQIEMQEKKQKQHDISYISLCSQLNESKAKHEEYEKNIDILNKEIRRIRKKADDESMILKAEITMMQTKSHRAEEKGSEIEQKLKETKAEIEERTKLLGDMVNHNKEIESDLIEARMIVSELQEENDGYVSRIDALEAEKEKNKKEIVEVWQGLKQSQDRVKRLDVENQKFKSQIESSKQQSKEITKLENEIVSLKDKIGRQESYLTRLLQKQKNSRVTTSAGETTRRSTKTSNSALHSDINESFSF